MCVACQTEADHAATVQLLTDVQYDHAFLFAYSQREKTHAHRQHADDVPEQVKQARLAELIDTHYVCAHVGSCHQAVCVYHA